MNYAWRRGYHGYGFGSLSYVNNDLVDFLQLGHHQLRVKLLHYCADPSKKGGQVHD